MIKVQGMYSVFDAKAESFGVPFYAENDNVARRIFGDAATGKDTMLHAHPEDFFLYKVGEFRSDEGLVVPCKVISLAKATDFVKEV